MDAYFRKLFLDPNPERRYPNYTELGKLFGVDADTSKRDIIVMQDRFELPLDEFKARGGWGYYELPPRLSGIWMQPGELLIVAASWDALEGRHGSGSEIGPKVRTAMEKLMNVGGGTLQIGNGFGGGAMGSPGTGDIFLNGLSNGTGSYAPSGTLLFNRAGTFTVTNNISGPGNLAQGATGGSLVLNRQFNVRNLQALAGTIRLDFAAASAPATEILNSIETAGSGSLATGFLTLRNGRLEIVGKDGTVNRQSFGLTGSFGAARISITPGTGGSVTLNLGALGKFHNSNDGGGTIRIDMPAAGVTVTAPNGGSAGQTAQNGIIVDVNTPWITIGDNDWARTRRCTMQALRRAV